MRYRVLATAKLAGRIVRPGESLSADEESAAPLVASGALAPPAAASASDDTAARPVRPRKSKAAP